MDPPVSLPRAAGTQSEATAMPEPEEEPPQTCAGFHGLSP